MISFFQQQTKGMATPDTRLVDATNDAGETALMRAMSVGKIPVVKTLLDELSDPFVQVLANLCHHITILHS